MLTGSLRRDLGLAFRRLRLSPAFTVFAVVTLGLGIGVATAACSAMYVLALRPSGVDTSNLVVLSRSNARAIVGLPVLVLLVACTNLSTLVISRGTSRWHACAVRAAMGASRARLIREEIAEVGVIAVAGGILGAVVAHGLLSWTSASLRETMSALSPDMVFEWRLEPVVFVAAGAATVLVMVVAGLLPALQLTRTAIGRLLTTDPIGAAPRWRGRGNLVALQVGVSVALFLITVVCV